MLIKIRLILFFLIAFSAPLPAVSGIVQGVVTDKASGEPLIGATVKTNIPGLATATDIDGGYSFSTNAKRIEISVSYIGYKGQTKEASLETNPTEINFELEPDGETLGEVTVTARLRHDSEVAQVREQQTSLVVQSGVSAQMITKTQDKDASEVIRRIPGVSIIDGKFIMVRGLSQRYNNVWLNGGAVPSSEADSRAFSFDILPASQLDNVVIVKSPAPEYPADFTGGFILVNTRQQPWQGRFDIGAGIGMNTSTMFHDFVDFHGGHSLKSGISSQLASFPGYEGQRFDPIASGLQNNWTLKTIKPLPDIKLNANYSRQWNFDGGQTLGLLASANHSQNFRTYRNMENSLYGPYDESNDKPVFLRKAVDDRYSRDYHSGGLLNLSFQPGNPDHFFEWKNVINHIYTKRYTERTGFNAQPDNIHDSEYFQASRLTYNTQVTGKHNLGENIINWCAGYAYANRDMPDRRMIMRTDRTEQTMGIYRISREFSHLDENMASIGANYERTFHFGNFSPMLKTGLYGEYASRKYRTRCFQYGWQPDNTLPAGFVFNPDVAGSVLTDGNYGPDKLYLYEEVNHLNDYNASRYLGAGYIGVNLPFGKFSVYGGVRYEFFRQRLGLNTRQYEESWQNTDYDYSDFFPSVNLTYKINEKNQIRAAYGRSVNRPEFRELSPSVFYDFELGSNVMGNYDLKAAFIDNIDLRYEWYPSAGEQISVALFYKHFTDPIEWTYTVAGGTDLVYSFMNAKGANNYGVELDIRKNLGFIGLKDFSFTFNGSLIKSKVTFPEGGNNIDRPMQGQSPYLINTGIFYDKKDKGWNAAVLYNRIGKRIIGVGNRYGTGTDGQSRDIPNSYEMPRNSLDISIGKRLGHWELKASVRDLLAERYQTKQFEEVAGHTVQEVTKSYRPGRNINISASYSF